MTPRLLTLLTIALAAVLSRASAQSASPTPVASPAPASPTPVASPAPVAPTPSPSSPSEPSPTSDELPPETPPPEPNFPLPTPRGDDYESRKVDLLPGLLFTRRTGGVAVHTFAYRMGTRLATATVVETAATLTMVDVLPTYNETRTLVLAIQRRTEKNVTRVYLTSEVEEHAGGAGYILAEVPDASVFALPFVISRISRAGFDYDATQIVEVSPGTTIEIDNVSVDFEQFERFTVPQSLYVTVAETSTVICGDALLVGFHYPIIENMDDYRAILQSLIDEQRDSYVPGRGSPGGKEIVRFGLSYMDFALATARAANFSEQYYQMMIDEYPELYGRGVLRAAAKQLDFPFPPGPSEPPSALPSPSGSGSESAAPPDDDDDDSVCFPADSTVASAADGRAIRMEDLAVGAQIRTGTAGEVGEVYFFSHRAPRAVAEFVEVTVGGRALRLSPRHYVVCEGKLVAAAAVERGMRLELADGSMATVAVTARVRARGLYAPHTTAGAGTLVVDGVLVSEFTQSVHPSLARALLRPVRWSYRLGLGSIPLLHESGHWAAKLLRWKMPSSALTL